MILSLIVSLAASWAGPIDTGNWFLRTSTTSPRFNAVTRGPELFVAVGENGSSGIGAMMLSADGGSWINMSGLGVSTLRAATFGTIPNLPYPERLLYVVAGDSKTLLHSADGLTWTKATLPVDVAPRAASHGCILSGLQGCEAAAYVVVGQNGILSSPDGVNWVQRKPVTPQPSSLFQYLNAVTFDGSYFVAVGGVLTGPDAYRARVLISADGASWTDVSPNPAVLSELNGVAYGNGVWLAVGGALSGSYETNTILRSTDRVNWVPVPNALPDKYDKATAVAFSGREFVLAKGYSGSSTLYTSPDGLTWTSVSIPNGVISGFNGRSFAVGPDTMVGVGTGGSTSVGIIQSSDVLRTRRGGSRDNPFTFYDSDDRPPTRIGLPVYQVNTAALNLALEGTLFYMKTRGMPVNFRLTFNAHPDASAGMFGKGWWCNYQGSLASTEVTARLTTGGGKTLVFMAPVSLTNASPSNPIALTPPTGVFDQLTCYGDHWIFKVKQTHRTYRFDRSTAGNTAFLTYLEDKNGNRISLDVNLTSGNVTAIRDEANRVVQFNYSGPYCNEIRLPDGRYLLFSYNEGRLVGMTDMNKHSASYGYDSDGFMTGMTVEGRSMSFNYVPRAGVTNGDKCLAGVTDPVNGLTRYEFVTNSSSKVKRTSAKGLVTLLSAQDGNTANVTDPLNNVRSLSYVNGLPSTFVNANKKSSTFTYDHRGNLTNTVQPSPLGSTTYAYNSDDFMTRRTDALGNRWDYAYDARGNLTTVTTPLTNITQMAYDTYGRLLSVTTPGSRTTVFTNDHFGNITVVSDPLGHATSFTFDRFGLRCTNIVDARGNQKNLEYDGNDRLTRLNYLLPGGATQSVSYAYNAFGLMAATDELGSQTSFERNLLGFITRATDPLGNASLYEYDPDNNQVKSVDPLGRVVEFAFDSAHRMTATTNALKYVLTRGYDPQGNLTNLTNYRGKSTQFTYDNANLLKTIKCPSASTTISYTRDKLGRITKLTNNRGQDVNSTYDKDGRLIEKRYGTTLFASYAYDGVGNLTTLTDAGGTTAYAYNARNETTGITYPDGKQISFSYDPLGNLAQVVYPDGTAVDYDYDALNRVALPRSLGPNPEMKSEKRNQVTSVIWAGGALALTYDAVANVTRVVRSNGVVTDCTYDCRGKLTSLAHRTGGDDIASVVCSYNPVGNCTSETNSGIPDGPLPTAATATYNDLDQITTWDGKAYTYDADGNLLTVGNSEQTAAYDVENRLLSITRSGVTTTFTYDGNGDRVSAVSGGKTNRYHYDRQGRLLFETDGSGNLTANNIYIGLRLVARGSSAAGYRYYHADRLGSTIALTDSGATVTIRYGYNPHGGSSGQGSPDGNPFTFVGGLGVMDEGNGLFFMKNRFYDATTGRFLQRDPIGFEGGVNLYAYANNNPGNYVDPSGLKPPQKKGDEVVAEKALQAALDRLAKTDPELLAKIKKEIILDPNFKECGKLEWHPIDGNKIRINPNQGDTDELVGTLKHEITHSEQYEGILSSIYNMGRRFVMTPGNMVGTMIANKLEGQDAIGEDDWWDPTEQEAYDSEKQ